MRVTCEKSVEYHNTKTVRKQKIILDVIEDSNISISIEE